MHHVEGTRRGEHLGAPGLDERRDAAVGDGHGVGESEAAFDPVDVVAEEPVQRLQRNATTLIGQNLMKIMFTNICSNGRSSRVV